MKKFTFSLDRALEWRRTQVRIEEMKLEHLRTERQALQARRKSLEEDYAQAVVGLIRSGPTTGRDLEALDHSRKAAAEQVVRLDLALRGVDRKIAAQTGVLMGRRRDARLIEQLRDEKLRAWRKGYLKELDQQAEESHLIRVRGGELGYNSPL